MTTTLSYVPAKVRLVLEQGDGWQESWSFTRSDGGDPPVKTDWDLTDWQVVAQLRNGPADSFTEVLEEITCEILGDPVDGVVRTSLTGVQTKGLPVGCFWELALVDPDDEETTVMSGKVTVQREVARRA